MGEARRRLAAILAADAVGYSRLMEADEDATVASLDACRAVFRATVAAGGGRVVDTAGDSVLAVFDSVVEAVRAAIAAQDGLDGCNRDLSDDRKMAFRIGINLGDVIEKPDGTIYGDGVNLAARLESLAAPGGVTISGPAFEQIDGKIDAAFDFAGALTVKNISRPVRTYRLSGVGSETRNPAPAGAKPAIAILPFDNMSGAISDNREQDFFADGITEDIITELARYPDLFVIARNSSFTYKGRAVKVQEVGADLGVRYVVEGSVRRSGERVRVTAQLIDCASGAHLWAERYDRELGDLFAVQDELTQAICATLPGRIRPAEEDRLSRVPPRDMAARDLVLAGRIHHHRVTRDDNAEALRLLDRAVELDPDFAEAHAWRGCVIGQAIQFGFRDDASAEDLIEQGFAAVTHALSLNQNNVECHRLLCEVLMQRGKLDEARAHNDRAFTLNPNDPRLVAQKGEVLTWFGDAEAGAEWIEKALTLDPHGAPGRAHLLGRAYYTTHRYEQALGAYDLVMAPRFEVHAGMAAAHAQLGNEGAAARHATALRTIKPDFDAGGYAAGLPYQREQDRAHLVEGLMKAGLGI
jgi:adenylate cyclase